VRRDDPTPCGKDFLATENTEKHGIQANLEMREALHIAKGGLRPFADYHEFRVFPWLN
jgi:hypothetical protein